MSESKHNSGGRNVILRVRPEYGAMVDEYMTKRNVGRYEATEALLAYGHKRLAALSAHSVKLKASRAARKASRP